VYAPNIKELDDWTKENKKNKAFKIERDVHRYPKRFKNAWDKIR